MQAVAMESTVLESRALTRNYYQVCSYFSDQSVAVRRRTARRSSRLERRIIASTRLRGSHAHEHNEFRPQEIGVEGEGRK